MMRDARKFKWWIKETKWKLEMKLNYQCYQETGSLPVIFSNFSLQFCLSFFEKVVWEVSTDFKWWRECSIG